MVFLNILIFYSPNYNIKFKNKIIFNGVTYKNLSLKQQFTSLYYSIKNNIKNINYAISIVHSTDFNDNDYNYLQQFDVDLIKTEPPPFFEDWRCGQKRFIVETKIKGTHRLLVELDFLFIKEPIFNWDVDFQAGYAGKIFFNKTDIDKVCDYIKINKFDKSYFTYKNLFIDYNVRNIDYNKLLPHFNNGLILIKETFAITVYNYFLAHNIFNLRNVDFIKNNKMLSHYIFQLVTSFILYNLSSNWQPFIKGINYVIKAYDVEKFNTNNIIVLHYAGIGGDIIAQKYFPNLFHL